MSVPTPRAEAGWVRFVFLPVLLLTAGLLGGLRVEPGGDLLFLAPPLVTLVMAVLLLSVCVRARLIRLDRWLGGHLPALARTSHFLTLLALFFATAQAFNSALPERGLLHWMFALFFLWTLWHDQFAPFDALRLLRSVAVLFGTAFVLKHLLLAAVRQPEGGWGRRLLGLVLEGVSLGSIDLPAYAPATGYVSFFTLALFVGGLALLRADPEPRVALALPVPREGEAARPLLDDPRGA
ncbi:MAG TPA: hypothetical protein VII13_03135 [Vicinamibacteria bacterium]